MFCSQVCCEVSADAAMAHGSVAPGAARPTAEAIAAKLEDGILNVTLPKSEHRKPRSIALN